MFDLSAFSLVGYCKLISSKVHSIQVPTYDLRWCWWPAFHFWHDPWNPKTFNRRRQKLKILPWIETLVLACIPISPCERTTKSFSWRVCHLKYNLDCCFFILEETVIDLCVILDYIGEHYWVLFVRYLNIWHGWPARKHYFFPFQVGESSVECWWGQCWI